MTIAKQTIGRFIVLGMAMLLAGHSFGDDVVVENRWFKLMIGDDAMVRSLILKSSGEECLAKGVSIPLATLTQNRPYDNEYQLIRSAKPWVIPANRISREGDLLRIGFKDEFHTLKVRVRETDDYVAFVPEGTDYQIEDFGLKRATEIDSIEFLRLPLADREHFGECANVVWNDKAAIAVMGLSPATRIDAIANEGAQGWKRFYAGTDAQVGLWGYGAALIATSRDRFLDCVDAMERDYALPRGVQMRRDSYQRLSYVWMCDVTPQNVGEFIEVMKAGGFRLGVVTYTAFASTCGHYKWRSSYPNGLADLKRVVDALRAAGISPGLHFHYTKVSTDDPYISAAIPDRRMATCREVVLARSVSPTDDVLWIARDPAVLRDGKGRKLIILDDEIVSYEDCDRHEPYRLTGVKRGLFGSKPSAHAANTYARHIDVDNWNRFIRCDPDSGILDEIAGRLAEIVDACGFEFLYFDGAEDVPEPYWYNVPKAQERVWSLLKTKPRGAETALKSHWGWHLFNRGNAFDLFNPKRSRISAEKYVFPCAKKAADDFSAINFGWLSADCPPEHVAYLGEKAREYGSPLSIQLKARDLQEKRNEVAALMAAFREFTQPETTSSKERK